jgi:polyisoprenoid-binding protein YceI
MSATAIAPASGPPIALAGRWTVDTQASHAEFVARTLGGLVKTPGRFRSLSGDLVADDFHAAGGLVIDAASIDTGNRMRDRHLRSREFFDVKRHPEVRYEVLSISSHHRGNTIIEGALIVADTRTPLTLDLTLKTPMVGVVELGCHIEVDRVALGIRGARAMVPRAVEVDVAITLRRANG